MAKRIKLTKSMFIKTIIGIFVFIFFMVLLYNFGFFITVGYLGEYSEALGVVYNYSLLKKIYLAITTGFYFAGFFAFCFLFYRIGHMLIGKDM